MRVVGSPDSSDQRAMAAALDVTNGVVALQSALGLWKVEGFTVEPLHVLTGRVPHRGTQHLGIVHSSVRLGPSDIGVVRRVPVTTPARTLFDLSARFAPRLVEDLCDDLLRRNLMTKAELHTVAAQVPLKGGPEKRRLLRVLADARPVEQALTGSRVEAQFERVVARAGLPAFERQVEIADADGFIGRVDFADRRLRIVVEVQSATFHSSLTDRRRDAERIRRLRCAGWIVIEVTDDEVWRRPDLVVERLSRAREAALHAA